MCTRRRLILLLLSLMLQFPLFSKGVILYFSYSGNTERVATILQEEKQIPMLKLEAKEPYTKADVNYYDHTSRSSQEAMNAKSRPALLHLPDVSMYNTIYLGYPIWWGEAPKLLYTFLEQSALEGKTIIPFCTSQSSGLGNSDKHLHPYAPKAIWMKGKRFSESATKEEILSWFRQF